jgi:hypothetical protein
MAAILTKSERGTVYLSLIVFALSMPLPAYRIQIWNDHDGPFSPGYEMAWIVEAVYWAMSWESIKTVFGATPVPSSGAWNGWQIFLPGAMANHLFLLACLMLLFRRFRTAVACSTLSALCAIGCLLPWQLIDFRNGWSLGPGYFVWCTATVLLAIATWRIAQRKLKSQPLLDGILTSRKTSSNGHDNFLR